MKRIFWHNRVFLIPFLIIWLLLGIVQLLIHKSTIHLYLNQLHSSFFDTFFSYLTHLGDGLTPPIIAIILMLFYSYRQAFIVGVGAAVAGLTAQFFKRVVFPDHLRPKAYFNDVIDLYFVPNVEVYSHYSFPSGHATTSFFLFFALAWMAKSNGWKVVWFVMALLTAYSRVYISQHFLVDIYFGAILGLVMAFIAIPVFGNLKANWLDKAIIKRS